MKELIKCYCGHTTTCDCGPEIDVFKHEVKVIPKEEILANRSNAYEFIDIETPEEAAERIYPMVGNVYLWHIPIQTRKIFIEGAKWQQEQICKSEFLQKLRGTLSDAEARRLIRTI